MKIVEILDIDNDIQDMVDIIKLETLPKIDKFIDNIQYISNDYTVPVDMFNKMVLEEFLLEAKQTKQVLEEKFDNNSRWVIEITRVIDYLSGNYWQVK